jgi:hypothetical protein
VKPFTFSESVVDPGEVVEQPDDVAAEANDGAASIGTAPVARSAKVEMATRPRTMRADRDAVKLIMVTY